MMEKPILVIGDKKIKLPSPTMKVWKEVVKFNSDYFTDDTHTIAETISACEAELAKIYGIDSDDIDDINPADVMPTYTATSKYIIELAMSKINDGGDEKNAGKAAEKH